ncbi:c-type cytochrome [Mesorhizobium marinum]|uniref:Cytochrome c n=1 Tax=Mesorhizobium marinum TaxID=3228790 RepID=A0ABV3R0U7_9HYPH
MRKLIFAISALALATSASFADPQEEREALMKANGRAMGALSAYVKGEKPFDAADVLAQLNKISEDAQKMDAAMLWPAGSATGNSESSPKIWEDPAGFQAAIDKFKTDAAAAAAAPPADVDALKASMGAVGSNCGTCHEAFRIKKG